MPVDRVMRWVEGRGRWSLGRKMASGWRGEVVPSGWRDKVRVARNGQPSRSGGKRGNIEARCLLVKQPIVTNGVSMGEVTQRNQKG